MLDMENLNQPESISAGDIENFLKRRLGEKEGESLMGFVNKEIEAGVKGRVEVLQNEIALWRNQLKESFATREDAAELKKRILKRVSRMEGTIILWGFVFWITLIFAFYIVARFAL